MKEFVRSLIVLTVMSFLTGAAYPLIVTGLSKAVFRHQAEGSLVISHGRIAGSSLIGQEFTDPGYFHGRPSALKKPYDARNSGGTNSGPSNATSLKEVRGRIAKIRKENRLDPVALIPPDLVLASASGLDPHISVEAAMLQTRRVAEVRGIPEPAVKDLVQRYVEGSLPGFPGSGRINVLQLNLALEKLARGSGAHPSRDSKR